MNTQDLKGKFILATTDEPGFNQAAEYFQKNVKQGSRKFIQEMVKTIKKTIKDKKLSMSKKFLALQVCMEAKTLEMCSYTAEKILDRLKKIALLTLTNHNTDTFNILNLECLYVWKDLSLQIRCQDCNSLKKIKKYKEVYDYLVKKRVIFPNEFMFFEITPQKREESPIENKKNVQFKGQIISEVHVINHPVGTNKQEDPLEELRKKLGKTGLVESEKIIDMNELNRAESYDDDGADTPFPTKQESIYQSEYIPTNKVVKLGNLIDPEKGNHQAFIPEQEILEKKPAIYEEKNHKAKGERKIESAEEKDTINRKIALLTGGYHQEDNVDANQIMLDYQKSTEINKKASVSVSSGEMAEDVRFNFNFEDYQKKEESSGIPVFGAGEEDLNDSFYLSNKKEIEIINSNHSLVQKDETESRIDHTTELKSFSKEPLTSQFIAENGFSKAPAGEKSEFRLSDTLGQKPSSGYQNCSNNSGSSKPPMKESKLTGGSEVLYENENVSNLITMMKSLEDSQNGLRREVTEIFKNFEALVTRVTEESNKSKKESNKHEKASQTKSEEKNLKTAPPLIIELEKIAEQIQEIGQNYGIIHENYRCLLKENAEIKHILQNKLPLEERNFNESMIESKPKIIINYTSAETEQSTEESLESSKRMIGNGRKRGSKKTEMLLSKMVQDKFEASRNLDESLNKSMNQTEKRRLSDILSENGAATKSSKPGKPRFESSIPASPSESIIKLKPHHTNTSYIQEESNDSESIQNEGLFNKVVFLEELMLKISGDIQNLQKNLDVNERARAEEVDEVVLETSRIMNPAEDSKNKRGKKQRKRVQELSDVENYSNLSESSYNSEETPNEKFRGENKKSEFAKKATKNVRLSSLLAQDQGDYKFEEKSKNNNKSGLIIDKKKQSVIYSPSSNKPHARDFQSERASRIEMPNYGRMTNISLSPVREESPAFSEFKKHSEYQFIGTGNKNHKAGYPNTSFDVFSLNSNFNHVTPVKNIDFEEKFPNSANLVLEDGQYETLSKVLIEGLFNTKLDDFKKMSLVNSGVVFENSDLFIDYNYELGFDIMSQKIISLTIKYGNKTNQPLRHFEIKSINYSGLKQASISEPFLAPGLAINQKVDLRIKHTEYEAIFLEISFDIDEGIRIVRIAMPASIIKFISYSKIDNRSFFERQWTESQRCFFCTECKPLNRKLFTSSKDIFDLPQYLKIETVNNQVGNDKITKTEYACSFDLLIKENFLMKIEEVHGMITFKIRVQPEFGNMTRKILRNLMFLFC